MRFKRLGGHTPGSSIALFPQYDIIYTGDLVFAGVYPTLLPDGDPFELIDALRKLKVMHANKYIPGHGFICDDNVIDSLVNYWQCSITVISQGIESGFGDNSIIEDTSNKCRVAGIEYDDFKHKRNTKSVLASIRNRS